jgi:predicted nucleotidyltransferase
MRFTPKILRKHAQLLVDKETKKDRGVLAVYLQGSLLFGSPLLGGAGDIDLVFIHSSPPEKEREIKRITPEIHFDIEHHDQLLYRRPRDLRVDPWLGPAIRDAQSLYDPRHFFDYTQAGVRSNYSYPENIQARTRPLIESARQFWLDRQISPPQSAITELPAFLEALIMFPEMAADAGAPGLAVALIHLLGGVFVTEEILQDWIIHWDTALTTLQEKTSPAPLLAQQKTYYQAALEAILQSEKPADALWPLLTTWTEAVSAMPDQLQLQPSWKKAVTSLGFAGKDYQIRLAAFDGFLDMCETLVLGEQAAS